MSLIPQFAPSKVKGLLFKNLNKEKLEQRDYNQAERAIRIINSDVWQKDFFPIIVETYDHLLDEVKAKKADPDVLKAIELLVARVDQTIQLGVGAIKRISERRLLSSQKLEAAKEVSVEFGS